MKKIALTLILFFFSNLIFGQSSLDSLRMVNPIGHTKNITSSKVRNNILYTSSMDKTVKLWDLKSNKELKTIYPSSDAIFDLDVTNSGKKILTTHQKNYIIIEELKENDVKKEINFRSDEICEKAFFASNDSLIISSVYNSDLTKSVIVYNSYTLREIKKSTINLLNENIQFSKDREYWFYLNDEKSINWNSLSKGKIANILIKLDFEISNYTFDNIKKELIVFGKGNLISYNLKNNVIRHIIYNLSDFGLSKIDLVIPSIDNEFIIVENKRFYTFNNNQLHHFYDVGEKDIIFSQNIRDSTIIFASDFLYSYNLKNKEIERYCPIDKFKETVNLECSEKYIAIQSEEINIYKNENLNLSPINFSSKVKTKYEIQNSSNKRYIAIQNSPKEIEVFKSNDFTSYKQVKVDFNIIEFRISNDGKLYLLNDNNKLSTNDVNNNYATNLHYEIEFDILHFNVVENLNQIWFITKENKLIKCNLQNYQIEENLSFNHKIKETTTFSNNLKSYFDINSDNYSFCELQYGEINQEIKNNKIDCSTGISEDSFRYGLSENGKYLSFIDKENKNLIIVDIQSGRELKKINISDIDEIKDVSISEELNLVYYGTYDDTIYCSNLLYENSKNKIKISEIIDLMIDDINGFLLITSSDGNFYLNKSNKFSKIYSLFSMKNGGYIVKLPNSPYYMCSKEASKMVHYVTPDLKVIGFDQLDPIYNRPDIVLDGIGNYLGGVDKQLVAQYRSAWEKRIERLGLNKEKLGKGEFAVPDAEIENVDAIPYENKEGEITFHVLANDKKHSLSRFNVLVNEVPIYGSQGISLGNLNTRKWDTTVTVPLSLGENKIQVSVMNELGLENFKYPIYVNYVPVKNDIAAKTYYIGIGVDDFKQETFNKKVTQLNYCVKDINDLGKVLSEDSNTIVKLYTNKQVIKENILSIKNFLLKSTTVNDRVIISCSSHGLLDNKNNFYLAMHDIDFENPSDRGLAYEDLENLLDGIPARKKLLLLDACNSGENELLEKTNQPFQISNNNLEMVASRGAVKEEHSENNSFHKMNELFINTRNKTGSVIISAAGGRQSALEGSAVKVNDKPIENGAFTYTVMEYLKNNKNNT